MPANTVVSLSTAILASDAQYFVTKPTCPIYFSHPTARGPANDTSHQRNSTKELSLRRSVRKSATAARRRIAACALAEKSQDPESSKHHEVSRTVLLESEQALDENSIAEQDVRVSVSAAMGCEVSKVKNSVVRLEGDSFEHVMKFIKEMELL